MAQPGGSPAPKPSTNPLASILKEKPKAQVVPPELPPAIPELAAAIPLPEVATRSMELSQILRDGATKLPTRDQIDSIQSSINELTPDLQSKLEDVNTMLAGSPNSLEVREEENYWRGMEGSAAGWEQQLLTWANNAQAIIHALDTQEPAWAATLEENHNNKELGPVLAVIEGNLRDIRKLRAQAQESLQLAVNMQINVGSFNQSTQDVIAKLAQARTKLKGRLLDRDSLPLWKISARREVGESRTVFGSMSSRWISIVAFLKENKGAIAFDLLLLLISLALAKRLSLMTQGKQPSDELETEAYRVCGHWVALGLLPPMIVGYVLAPTAPVTLVGLLILVSFFPVLIILPPLLNRRFKLLLYVFAALYACNWLISWLGLSPSARREGQFLIDVTFVVVLGYLARPSPKSPDTEAGWGQVFLQAIRFGIALIGISLVADMFGYVKLAHYLGVAVVYSAFIAISVLTTLRVCSLLFNVGLRSPFAERLAAVRLHRQAIVRWLPRILIWTGIAVWVIATLDLVGLDSRFYDGVNSLLDFRISGSANGATLGGVLGFFVILVVGYGFASAIRFFFREEVFRRVHMSRGLPELIASIIYYMILVIVFLAAINAGGIELNKLTVLTGAFGVGIGFGMQNIINNFVSGLILQFERPIHIDDIIEVDTNTGKVTRIGVRSSTIQTFQGAEVIIPNANLISSKVINWTLSESQRRRELPVGVAYGSDSKLVLKLLREAAAKHELVLTKPEPMVYFTGFGESALNFELHFWVMQENNGLLITSEVAQAVMQLLGDAGIQIPFPQRDLHLRTVEPNASGMLPLNPRS
ncbi:MAG TPA: mechanosensitive ion channel domain-containing protein [Candidatus Angelobacter sp.]|nr:mechanosensitive ion channel domain-containing protein [Candidatus Angelobacter sp.]